MIILYGLISHLVHILKYISMTTQYLHVSVNSLYASVDALKSLK